MKLISWNVNGIRACLNKGFSEFFKDANAEIFCLQETKCQLGQVELNFDGYESYCVRERKNAGRRYNRACARDENGGAFYGFTALYGVRKAL